MIELLSPAGNFEKMKAAIRFGADAVYMSGQTFGMRAASAGMPHEELEKAVNYAHAHGVRVYVTVNTMPREYEYAALRDYILFLGRIAPDALIVADIGVISLCRELLPTMKLHLSTQANAVSSAACRAWASLGISKIVLARELTLNEIKEIRKELPMSVELEVFVHGSMCISYSGRCLLSAHLNDRDANRGACTQPCRWGYTAHSLEATLYEDKRPNTPIPVIEEKGETFFMSSTDLCMIEHLPELIESGVTSLKIEGRMKSAYYTAVVTNTYRMAIESAYAGKREVDPLWLRELASVSHREYATGFFFDDCRENARVTKTPGYSGEKAYLADVLSYSEEKGEAYCVQRNKLQCGDRIELLTPGHEGIPMTVEALYDAERNEIESAPHPQMNFYIKMPFKVKEGDILRMSFEEN